MGERRAQRSETLSGVAALLDALEPGHHALTRAMAKVPPAGATYAALLAVSDAMHRLAAKVGHEGRFMGQAPARPDPVDGTF